MARTTLDVKGLICPLPVLRANKALRPLTSGDELEVLVTDPAAPADFEAFSETTGHAIIETGEADGVFTIVLQKT